MADVGGRPFLEWILGGLRRQGIREVTLSTGYLGEVIAGYFGDGERMAMKISYSKDPRPLGTAGAIRHAVGDDNRDQVLVLNGDSYCPVDLSRLRELHTSRQASASLWLLEVPDARRYGAVEITSDGKVAAFVEKPAKPGPSLISAGVYLFEPEVITMIPAGEPLQVETAVFPKLINRGLHGFVGDGIFIDIGTPESYRRAAELMTNEMIHLDGNKMGEDRLERVEQHLHGSASLQRETATRCGRAIVDAADVIAAAFRSGCKVLLCGNGGSAADCQHMAAEFVSALTKEFQRPALAALALTTDTSVITAFANDFGFEGVFERQVLALGKPGDVLVAISTSGSSMNVRRAVKAARSLGMHTVGLLGEGGPLTNEVELRVVVPSRNTQFVQEALLPVEHTICDLVERTLYQGALAAK
jgi:phosphoheptose isomerase